MKRYAWIIDKDYLENITANITTEIAMGPSDANDSLLDRLRADSRFGHPFRIYDDDGELYFSGRIAHVTEAPSFWGGGPDDEWEFAPLWDFGTPDSGATEIRYKNDEGKWQTM